MTVEMVFNRVTRGPRGEARVPPDKSISHRAAILGALAEGVTVARPFLRSADCMSTLACLRSLGVGLTHEDGTLRVEGGGPEGWREPEAPLDAGNSATTMRLLAGALAGMPIRCEIRGDASLSRRPMARIVEPLRAMGAEVEALGEGMRPPLVIHGGRLRGIDYEMPVDSAQLKSALLLAGLQAEGETRVRGGKSSRDHTERMLALMDADITFQDDAVVVRRSTLKGREVEIPGDISSASFLLAAAALLPGSRLSLRGVGLNPTRAGFLSVLNSMGALVMESSYRETDNEPRGDLEVGSAVLSGVEVEGWRVPAMIDEVPLLAVLGCRARGETVVWGAGELRVKESDRIAAICCELAKMGGRLDELEDGFVAHGPTELKGARVDSHGDHRIAMSLAVAALCAEGETVIAGWECVDISFPGFAELLRSLL